MSYHFSYIEAVVFKPEIQHMTLQIYLEAGKDTPDILTYFFTPSMGERDLQPKTEFLVPAIPLIKTVTHITVFIHFILYIAIYKTLWIIILLCKCSKLHPNKNEIYSILSINLESSYLSILKWSLFTKVTIENFHIVKYVKPY